MKEKIKKGLAALAAVGCLFGCSACHKIAGNYPSYGAWATEKSGDGFVAEFDGEMYYFDLAKGTAEATGQANLTPTREVVVSGGTAPRYFIDIAAGYEGIEDDLVALEEEGDSSVIDCYGIADGDSVYGICNVYADTVGYLSGGGNYAVEEISRGIFFRYDSETDTFSVLTEVEDAMLVAFSHDTLLYWKDKKYYALKDGVETFLFDDMAYDAGLQHQSSTGIFFDGDYALFWFLKAGWGNSMTETVYVYSFSDGQAREITMSN